MLKPSVIEMGLKFLAQLTHLKPSNKSSETATWFISLINSMIDDLIIIFINILGGEILQCCCWLECYSATSHPISSACACRWFITFSKNMYYLCRLVYTLGGGLHCYCTVGPTCTHTNCEKGFPLCCCCKSAVALYAYKLQSADITNCCGKCVPVNDFKQAFVLRIIHCGCVGLTS